MGEPEACDETVGQVMQAPTKGDMLCFDGKEWRVARRKGWHYQVPEHAVPQTDESNEQFPERPGV